MAMKAINIMKNLKGAYLMIKKATSATVHTTSEGKRLSYTYSVVDETSGEIQQENIRQSMIVMDTEANQEVLSAINTIMNYIQKKLG